MRTKLEVLSEVACLPAADLLDLLRTLEQTANLTPRIRTRYVEYAYSNYTVARYLGHYYLNAHTQGDRESVQAIDEALNKFYQEA